MAETNIEGIRSQEFSSNPSGSMKDYHQKMKKIKLLIKVAIFKNK